MHETAPPVQIVADLSLGVIAIVFIGLFCAGLAVRMYLVARRPKSDLRLSRTGSAGEISWLCAPVIVAATFAGIAASDQRRSEHDHIVAMQSRSGSPVKPAGKPLDPSRRVEDRTMPQVAESLVQRPAWIDRPPLNDGIVERVVISSQQYSTREEAEQELIEIASQRLMRDLQQLFPGSSRGASWRPTAAALKQFAVKQEYVEVAERDFGTFVHPMYRVWWQLELSPEVRTEFLPVWRQSLTSGRIIRVGLVASTLVLLTSLLAFTHRLIVLTGGTWRNQMRVIGGLATLVWISVVFMLIYVARHPSGF